MCWETEMVSQWRDSMDRLRNIIFRVTSGFIFFFSLLGTGYGEDPPLTLSQSIDLALSKNPVLKAAGHRLEAAKAGIGQARSAFLPRIDINEFYNRTNSPMMVAGDKMNQEVFGNKFQHLNDLKNLRWSVLTDPPPISNFNTQFLLTQPIFDQGKALVGMKQARLRREGAEDTMERVKQEVIFEVTSAFCQVILVKEDLKVALESEKTAEAHVKLAEDLLHAGQVVKSDLLSAKVRLMEIKEMVIQANNGLEVARASLNKAIGIDQYDFFEVEGVLVYEKEKLDLQNLITDALKQRPDLLAMETKVKNASETVTMTKTNYLPSLTFMAQYDLNDRDLWNQSGESWTVWGVFRFNLFDGLNTTSQVKEAKEQSRNLSHLQDELTSRIELEVRESFYRLREGEERVKVSSEAVAHAEESLRIVEDRYRVGLSNMVELLDNEVALTRARRNLLKAGYDCRVARSRLDLAVGTVSPLP